MYPIRKEWEKKNQVSSPWGAEKKAAGRNREVKEQKKKKKLFKKPQLVNGVQCYGEVKDQKN